MANHNTAGEKQSYLPSRVAREGKVDSLESKTGLNPSEAVDQVRTNRQGGRVDLRVNEANLEAQLKLNSSVQ